MFARYTWRAHEAVPWEATQRQRCPVPARWELRRPRLSYGPHDLGTAAAQNLWGAGVAN